MGIDNEPKLPMFSGEDSICDKCGGRGTADVVWVPPGEWTGMPGQTSQILSADEIAKNMADEKGLMLRNCICGYSWNELPLDWDGPMAPDDPRDGEIAALRKLVGKMYMHIPYQIRDRMAEDNPTMMRVAKLVMEEWAKSQPVAPVVPEDDIPAAAPYFAPLRPEGQ